MEILKTKNTTKILLVDRYFPFDKLSSTFDDSQKVISFDYESDRILIDKKISHDVSDEFLNNAELLELQNISYSYANWFRNEKFKKYLEHDEINIGDLCKIEFHYFLLPFYSNIASI